MMILETPDEELKSSVIKIIIVFGGIVLFIFLFLKFAFGGQGVSQLVLKNNPGEIGGDFTGEIQTNAKLISPEGVKLTLTCYQRLGDKRKKVWEESKIIAPDSITFENKQHSCPVGFNIPAELPETIEERDNHYSWHLKAENNLKKWFKYSAHFGVPFRSA